MTGLVEELQRDAVDPSVAFSVLLRKVKITASKLSLDNVLTWVDAELSGYRTPDHLPAYRLLTGTPRAYNPVRQDWIPIHVPTFILQEINKVYIADSVAALETLCGPPNDPIFYRIAPHYIEKLNSMMQVPFPDMGNFVQKSQLVGILDQVRNEVLDWALGLERKGITGNGMSFTEKERSIAKDPIIIIGSIQNFTGTLGFGNRSGDINR